ASRLAHWSRRLGDAPELGLPLDHPRPARRRFRGGVAQIAIASEVVGRLRGLGHSAGATLFQVMASAFAVLLHRYSDQDDIVFGTVTDLRQRPELESMVGYCLTPLVVRADVRGDPPFVDLLGRIRDELLSALTN